MLWTSPPLGGDHATLSYQFTSANAFDGMEKFIEGEEFAPRRGVGQIQREISDSVADGRERRRLLVTREAGELRLLVVRWRAEGLDDSSWYFRCEAALAGGYEAALPVFEAVCDAVRVRIWEYGW
jgi:hypothetical protein